MFLSVFQASNLLLNYTMKKHRYIFHLLNVFVGMRDLCPPNAALTPCQAMSPCQSPPASALLVDPKLFAEFAILSSFCMPHAYPSIPPSPPCCHVIAITCAVAVTIFLALPRCSTTERTLHQDQKGASHETGGQTSGIPI